jgi:YidC/Oxa1 family membrane protein insertase
MLDSLFEGISTLLNIFYELVPNYAVAIALLTCAVMLITTPLTLKGTRSMIEMQRLQPEIRRLQAQYKDDRQKLNEEMMRFYREHEINPVGGCLPMLIQLPVFSILFYVVRGLTNNARFVAVAESAVGRLPDGVAAQVNDGFRPKYLDHSSELYQSLLGRQDMPAFGVDLAQSPSQALGDGFATALPYVLIVAVIALLSWYQQKQIMGRQRYSEVSPQQQMMMRLGPALYVMFAFVSPAALCVYFLVSTMWRVAQQFYITRSLYGGEDSIGAQAQKAMAQARAEKQQQGRKTGGNGSRAAAPKKARAKSEGTPAKKSASSRNGSSARSGGGRQAGRAPAEGASSGASGARAKPHPRSRKKKKRK